MLRQSVSRPQGAPTKAFSRSSALQSYISDCRKLAGKPTLAYNRLVDRVKAASSVHVPSSSLSVHAFADGVLHLTGPRYASHLLIILMAATVATVSGISSSRMTRSAALAPWQFEPFANRSFSQAKNFLDKPVLPFTITPKRNREAIITYDVVAGDTLTSIADRFEISLDSLISANKLDDADSLSVGDKLAILPVSGILHTVKDGDTVESIAAKYQVDPQVIIDSEYNHLSEPYALFIDQKLIVPGGKMPEVPRPQPSARSERPIDAQSDTQAPAGQSAPAPAPSAPVRGGGRFIWPTYGPITQGFSAYHTGIDIGPPYGTTIYAAESGVVVSAAYAGDYGYNILIDHGDGYVTRYAHASKFLVSAGQQVSRGQPIALVGSTGRSTGPHLHFEIYQNGVRVNPLRFLP